MTVFLIRKSLMDQLAGERFDVYEAKDGPTGLAKAEEVNPDVILLDFVMPGMNGYEVYQALRANPKFADTPVIVISSSYDEVVSKFGYPFVGFDFLAKQFTKEQLEERINAVLPMIASSPEHVGIAVTGETPAPSEADGVLSHIQAQLAEISQKLQEKPVWLPELPTGERNDTAILNQLQNLEAQIQALEQRPPGGYPVWAFAGIERGTHPVAHRPAVGTPGSRATPPGGKGRRPGSPRSRQPP